MFYEKKKPSRELEPFIECYWIMIFNNTTIRGIMPTANISVLFHKHDNVHYEILTKEIVKKIGPNIDYLTNLCRKTDNTLNKAIIGPHKDLVLETSIGKAYTIGIEFKPGIRKTFFGNFIASIANTIIPNNDNITLNELGNIIFQVAPEEIFENIDQYLLNNYLPSIYTKIEDELIFDLIQEATNNPFKIQSKDLAEKYHLCQRQFDRIFKNSIGITAKQFLMSATASKIRSIMTDHLDYTLQDIVETCKFNELSELNYDLRQSGGLSAKQIYDNIHNRISLTPGLMCINDIAEGIKGIHLF